jgi:ParB-like chromosome segregation protein Spo0J
MAVKKLESVSIEALIPYARNARKHSDEQVAQLAASIREFGFNAPVLVDSENGIIAGHGRVLAARKLGLEAVPCLRIDHLTETQRRAYILADNRLAELGGGWDDEMLGLELADLKEADFDLDLAGFDSASADQGPVALDEVNEIKEECCLQIVCKDWDERTEAESILGGRKIKWPELRKLAKL